MNNKGKAKAIRLFYAKNQTSNIIREMKVNIKELNNRLSTIKDIDKYLDEQYKALSIKRFYSKNEMMQYIVDTGNINNVKMYQKTIDQRWNEYLHREDLIITGQYQNYVKNYYKNNYIRELAKNNIDADIISALQELNEEEWATLASLRASDKDNPNNYALPMIDTYYDTQGLKEDEKYKGNVEQDIINAYKQALGKDIGSNVFAKSLAGNDIYKWETDNNLKTSAFYNYANTNNNELAKTFRKMPKSLRNKIGYDNKGLSVDNKVYETERDARFATIELMEKHGTAKMRTTKRGTQYYPFYLNRNETAEYIAWKHNRGE
ncbi:MAG: hypothetical protein SPJ07_01680 [Bacilli bacterium]|nr:hypothetical protein [Bacilli bacterium]